MAYPKILTVQDISCVGQCSLTVALPIISACGIETCVLPSAVLSTHTAGFSGYTFRDLTDDIQPIQNHWKKEGIVFDGIYTGYLGSARQIDLCGELFSSVVSKNCLKVVDPAMADNGKLYPGFDEAFASKMKDLCVLADYVVPNITEACFLTGIEYKTEYDRAYIDRLLQALSDIGCQNIVLTGVSYRADKTGVVIRKGDTYDYYEHDKQPNSCHGTGDIYASAFVGALIRKQDPYVAARIAADYTVACIQATAEEENHWYGAKFEPVLGKLIEWLR